MRTFTPYFVATVALVQFTHAADKKWYEEMVMGPAWSETFSDYFQGEKRTPAAIKGIVLDLGNDNHALFDSEALRLVTAYKGDFEWGGVAWAGSHGTLITLANKDPLFNTASMPGWGNKAGSFEDKREHPGYGKLEQGSFNGYFRSGETITLDYTVLGSRILETDAMDKGSLTRSFYFDKRNDELVMVVAEEKGDFTLSPKRDSAKSADGLEIVATGGVSLVTDTKNHGRLLAKIPRGGQALQAQIAYSRSETPKPVSMPDFKALVSGGKPIFDKKIKGTVNLSNDKKSPYVTDVINLPENNPWKSNLRFVAFDFLSDDKAAISTWNGDVWTLTGIKDMKNLVWQRVASGLFQPLGLKVVDGTIYVNGRDGITKLIDLNNDGEIDQYKVFNHDVIVTENFHEFAFELQTDKEGNFYFSKASPVRPGGRGFDKILDDNGVIAKVSKDGSKLEVLATGLRAPGGLGIGPNGEITSGENEGTWMPSCKINYVKPGNTPVFFGVEPSRHDVKGKYTEPLCYLPMDVDNSGASQVWVPEGIDFGVPAGEMLHLSYGTSSIFHVLTQPRGNTGFLEGGVVKLPIKLQSSAMRARFHKDGSLYVAGFRGWQTNAASEAAFQRVRHNPDVVVPAPTKMEYTSTGIKLTFPAKLDKELAEDPTSYSAQRWNYVRGPQYGSGEFSVDHPDRDAEKQALEKESHEHQVRDDVEIKAAKLSADGMTVDIELDHMKPCMNLKVTYDLEDTDGEVFKGEYIGTVYKD
ncbi:hypothetical protein JIN85_01155 [Luteolibacter pohnpeiensis]|uniref:DUF6797 domain-containing protein n=1 Tax=Luteolibacter pohnpeiensis TaxID=454153 RepID=A0A934VUC7_9BACT|nr:DUF6797 domain-containing protein [Luteolibacter pohnpeiensis]MBK1881000.1 hypothetical protein [Luteolibacter pohnpeiensis]